MITSVQKWGNSLALRIPKTYAAETQIHDGSAVEISLQQGKLIITPVRTKIYSLDELLKDITPENQHDCIETGTPMGREIW